MTRKDESTHPLDALKFLIGAWKTEGEMLDEDGNTSMVIKGTDTYAWTLDDQFILHTVDVMMGEERTEAIELIGGYDQSKKTYQLHSFDNQGSFSLMEGIFENEKFIIHGDQMKATLQYEKQANEMNALWEKSEDDKVWIPWMRLRFSI